MRTIEFNVSETGCQETPMFIGYQGENAVTRVIVNYSAWVEEFGPGTLSLEVMRAGDTAPYLAPLTVEDDQTVWTVTDVDTGARGEGAAGFVYTVDEQVKKSAVFRFFVGRDVGGTPGERPDPYESLITYMERLTAQTEENASAAAESASAADVQARTAKQHAQAAATARTAAEAAQQAAEEAKNYAQTFTGAPRVAASAAQMTDTDLIYVYTGTTSGTLTTGHWYYWDGNAWTDGGVYNSSAVQTDPTLTVSGAPADAKATGDAVTDLKSAINDPVTGLDTKAPVIVESASGTIAHFTDGADSMPVKALTIDGAESASVIRTGINLFDKNTGIQLETRNLRVARTIGQGVPFLLRKGITYTFSCNSDTPAYIYLTVPYSGDGIAGSKGINTYFTYTPENDIEVGFNFFWMNGRPADATDIMVEIGSVKHNFESYESNIFSYPSETVITLYGVNNIWSDAGDVDVLYCADTKLYIDNKIAELQALVLENMGG